MKYLWVVKNFPPSMGGVQQYTYQYVKNFPDSSCVVMTRNLDQGLDSSSIDNVLQGKGHKIFRLSSFPDDLSLRFIIKNPFSFKTFFIAIFRLIKSENIQHVVFAHPSFVYFFSAYILRFYCDIKFSCVFHGEDIPMVNLKSNFLFRLFAKKLNTCICNSKFTHERLEHFIRCECSDLIAYPGVEDRFFEVYDFSTSKDKFNVRGRKVLYTVGRLDERKGHDLVIRSLPLIIKKHPDVIYLIGGKGPYLSYLQSLVSELELQNYVRFCGFIKDDEICEFHNCGDIFVMPNRILEDGDTEGFGIVFLEAGASGNPVIGGRAGGALDSVIDRKTGYLVDPYDCHELVDKVSLLLNDSRLARRLGAAGKQRAYDSFRWPSLAPVLVDILKQKD